MQKIMLLKTQEYILNNGIDKLINTYNLVARYSKRYPNLVQLCYHQLDTPKNELTNECRGLILDMNDNFKVISYPFFRFNDYDDRHKSKLDLDSIKFYDKLDGSIISMYYYGGEWNVSTKTLPDADGKILNHDSTFRELFFDTFKNLGYVFPENKNMTYVFEFMFKGQGITQKDSSSISLIMVRDLETLDEVDHIQIANKYGWNKTVPLSINSIEEATEIVKNLDPIVSEGYVICDKNFKRFKLKSPQFDKIQELKVNYDNTEERQVKIEKDNFRRLCDIIRTNKHESFIHLEKYATVKPQFKKVKSAYKNLLNATMIMLNKVDGLVGKELGLYLKEKDKWFSGLCFGITNGKIDKSKDNWLEDYFYNMNIKTFEEIIKKYI